MKFYTYILLDQRFKGNFTFGQYSFNYLPFYVGKGKNDRYKVHFMEAQNNVGCNIKKNEIINNIIEELNKNPKVKKIICRSEERAFFLEKKLIKLIGRLDLETGPLTNLTNGGEGNSGFKLNSQQIENRRINSQKRNLTESGYKGVCFIKRLNKYEAQIGYKQKLYHLGTYTTAKKAALAYDKAARFFYEFEVTLNLPKKIANFKVPYVDFNLKDKQQSKYKGVCKDTPRNGVEMFRAYYKNKRLGTFTNEEEAAHKYDLIRLLENENIDDKFLNFPKITYKNKKRPR